MKTQQPLEFGAADDPGNPEESVTVLPHLTATDGPERGTGRRGRHALRLTNTPVRLFQQAHWALAQNSGEAQEILSRLRRHFRQYGRSAAQEKTPIQRIFGLVRHVSQVARDTQEQDRNSAAGEELVLQALEAAVQGYLQGQESEAKLDQSVRDDALRLLEEERRRLARELHDETGQILTATLFKIDACLAELPTDRTTLDRQLRDIRQTLLTVTRDLHRLVYSLRPPMLTELGLVPTLRWLVRQFETQYHIATQLTAPNSASLSDAMETAIFRIVQEALTNIARHAKAQTVRVELSVRRDQVSLLVADDGVGFDPQSVMKTQPSRLGLLGMRERARHLGGQISITSAPGLGTTILVTLPLQGEEHE